MSKKYQRWSEKDVEFLRLNYSGKTNTELAQILNRDRRSIRNKARGLKLKKFLRQKPWTEIETRYLKEHYRKERVATIAKKLNRTKESVYCKISNSKLCFDEKYENNSTKWSPSEDSFLMMNWGKLNLASLCRTLKRTKYAIISHAIVVGIGGRRRGTFTLNKLEKLTGYLPSTILLMAKKHKIPIHRMSPYRPGARTNYAIKEENAMAIIAAFQNRDPDETCVIQSPSGSWGHRKPPHCLKCGTKNKPHVQRGLCKSCFYNVEKERQLHLYPRIIPLKKDRHDP